MAQVPLVSNDPIEVLTNKGLIEEPFVNKYWGVGLPAALGFFGVCLSNWQARRPMLSGIQRHVLVTLGAAAIGKFVDDYRNDYLAERDAILRDYIRLHRDEFPDFQRKKYSAVLEPWIPIR